MRSGIPVETATRVYRRYLKLEPTHVEEYIAYLKKQVSCRWSRLHGFPYPAVGGDYTAQPSASHMLLVGTETPRRQHVCSMSASCTHRSSGARRPAGWRRW
jgi:hypothetical protein